MKRLGKCDRLFPHRFAQADRAGWKQCVIDAQLPHPTNHVLCSQWTGAPRCAALPSLPSSSAAVWSRMSITRRASCLPCRFWWHTQCASYCSSVVAQFRSCHFTHVMTKCGHSCGKPVYESVAGWHSPQTSFCVLAKMRHALLLRYNPHIQEHQSVHARHYAVENVSVHKHALALLPPLCA